MIVRFFIDTDTELPHVLNHGISPAEVLEVLRGNSFHGPGREASRVCEGQTLAGRYLRVIYRERESDGSLFVITAYELNSKAKLAFRKRRRRRP